MSSDLLVNNQGIQTNNATPKAVKHPEKNADRISILAYFALMPAMPEKTLLGIIENVVYVQVAEPVKIMNFVISNPFSGKELTTQTVSRFAAGNSREETSDFEFAIERGLNWDIDNGDIQRLLPYVKTGLSHYAPQYTGNAKAPIEQAELLVKLALQNVQSGRKDNLEKTPLYPILNSEDNKEEKQLSDDNSKKTEEKLKAKSDQTSSNRKKSKDETKQNNEKPPEQTSNEIKQNQQNQQNQPQEEIKQTGEKKQSETKKEEKKLTPEEKIRASWNADEIKSIVDQVILALKYKDNASISTPLIEGIKAQLTSKQQFIAPLLAEEQKGFKQ